MIRTTHISGLLVTLSLISCHTLPPPVTKTPSKVLIAEKGTIARTSTALTKARSTAVIPIASNKTALDARLAIIDSATRSLDFQMFIWMNDYTGKLIMERILTAADRGVRVRILLDDLLLGISYRDRDLATIASHPKVEIRLYNPQLFRDRMITRMFDMLARINTANQRMHNKTIIADGKLAILSGRNVGDHYFGYGKKYNMVDFGALLSGQAVQNINAGFDRYWNSTATYDITAMRSKKMASPLASYREKVRSHLHQENQHRSRPIHLTPQKWQGWYKALSSHAHYGTATYTEDDPDLPCASRDVITKVLHLCQSARKEIILVTPYLVPDQRLLNTILSARARNVKVTLIIPTVASNNHLIVHNQYQKYRLLLLLHGVNIYEFKHRPGKDIEHLINEGANTTHKIGLHTKLVIIDSHTSYIGSLNLDGRAMFINTEEGIIVRSHSLASEVKNLTRTLSHPENAWQLHLTKHNKIIWKAGTSIKKHEPFLDLVQAALERIARPLPLRHALFPDKQAYRHTTLQKIHSPSGAENTPVQYLPAR